MAGWGVSREAQALILPGRSPSILITERMPTLAAQSVLRAGGLLHTFGSRRSAAVYADSLNYEAMLALDENNVRRGVRRAALDRLHTVCAPGMPASLVCISPPELCVPLDRSLLELGTAGQQGTRRALICVFRHLR